MKKSKELIVLDAEKFGVQKSKAKQIEDTFVPMVEMLKGFESDFNEIVSEEVTEDLCKRAKRLRLDISKVRIETEKMRKEEGDEFLRAKKAIDGVANILKYAVKDKEDSLQKIENHFLLIKIEAEKKLAQERSDELEKYNVFNVAGLGSMSDDVYKNFILGAKTNHEAVIAAEKKAEEERVEKAKAEAAERERIRKENEQLKKEAEIREKKAEEERIEREKKEAAEKAKAEKAEKIRKDKEAKEKAAQEDLLRLEREKREKAEQEIKAKKEAEKKAEEDRLQKIQDDLNKGDAAKVKDLISDLNTLKTKYTFKSKKNQKMISDVNVLIEKIINHIK